MGDSGGSIGVPILGGVYDANSQRCVVEVWESEAAMRAWPQDTIAPKMATAGGAAPQHTVRRLHHRIVK